MKFSYTLLKKIAPGIKSKAALVEKLNIHAFEAENREGDTVEIAVPANRYSDASSHAGVARIASAIFGGAYQEPPAAKLKQKDASPKFDAIIAATAACPRYSGLYAEIKKIVPSPAWMQAILVACGLRPINNVVDVMNYVTLEWGQPLHAFDADLVSGTVTVRMAKKGEKIETIDREAYELSSDDIIIADAKGPLAIAGIKGGGRAEVNDHTKRVIIEAANFDAARIYKTSRRLGLLTDAALRFSHGITPWLVEPAMRRVAKLLEEVVDAKAGDWLDRGAYKAQKTVIRFHPERFHALTGLDLSESTTLQYLQKLGFGVKGSFVEVPPARTDVSLFEDLVEEIVNIKGYDALPSAVPHVGLLSSGYEDRIALKDEIRNILRGMGMSETYNYSFISRADMEQYASVKAWGAVELENPISVMFQYLRPGLYFGLLKNTVHNLKFFNESRLFEIGNCFRNTGKGLEEPRILGLTVAYRKGSPFLELKGMVEGLLEHAGLTDFSFSDTKGEAPILHPKESLRIESDHHLLGHIGAWSGDGSVALAEINMDVLQELVEGEKSYEPLSKYPSVMRDISLFVGQEARIGNMLVLIQNAAPKYLEDVDMIDFYQDPKEHERKSVTFRVVFQAKDRTFTDKEVEAEMAKITKALEDEFDAEIR